MATQKRRGYGEGSVRQRNDGRWECRLYLGTDPLTGKIKQRSFYGHTQKEATDKMLEARGKILNGEYIEPNRITVAQWMDTWFKAHVQTHVKQKTELTYQINITNKINPALGHIYLQRLTRDNIQLFINELAKTLSAGTVKQVYAILHKALEAAVVSDYIRRNVSDNVTLPRVDNTKTKTLTADEVERFCAALPDDTIGRVLHFIALTGLRVGEACALRWSDINGDVFTVNRTVLRIKGEFVYNSPKSKSGVRTLPLPSAAKPLLDRQRKAQLQERMKCGKAWHDNDIVFASSIGEPLFVAGIDRQMQKTLAAVGLPKYTVHDLRHAWGTNAIARGNDAKTVSTMLGHSNVGMTLNRYTHTNMDIERAVVEADSVLRK